MSGLLERIVRRRRASASSRLGPPTQNGHPSAYEVPSLNGHTAELPVVRVNGSATAHPVSEDAAPTIEHRLVVEDDEPAPVAASPEPAPALALPEPLYTVAPLPEPAFRERGRLRRRARYLRRVRELQMRDLGGFLLELHRFGADRADLVQAKLTGAAQTDSELRALEQALDRHVPLRQLREPGIGGACTRCGAVHGSEDRFCANCGEPLAGSRREPDRFPDR